MTQTTATDHFDEHERRMNDESTLKTSSAQQDNPNEETANDDDEEEFDENDTTEVGRFKERGEFTFRSIAVGALIGILVGAMNVNFGLRTGWTQGGKLLWWMCVDF